MSLAVLAYVFVTERDMTLPDLFPQWANTKFTREFYLCDAFPSRIANADQYFGFAACDHAIVARYNLIALTMVSAAVVGLSIAQIHTSGTFAYQPKTKIDAEKTIVAQGGQQQVLTHGESLRPTAAVAKIQPPKPCLRLSRSAYGYYAKL
ncbi:hypothetical protein B0J11DRAFT_577745 [Dendryphion nanum]|uniref:Uncharacterized protein n=1 Tax=Dendryphion nanum TaxID=256645 RepID=A0A9P9E3G5_9PLEO|nr:hypothetical protein B0J11DRAFT_577745 [Dendryphion nanum]